jgi:hypothetical protein
MSRIRVLGTAVLAAVFFATNAAPSLSGDPEVAFLQSLAGEYAGEGEITGDDGGPVKCRLTFKPSGVKLNYTGRCSGGGSSRSFSGSIRFNDSEGRWESSSQGKTVAGRMEADTLTFATRVGTVRGTVTSVMSLAPDSISVSFELQASNGELSWGTIPFARS